MIERKLSQKDVEGGIGLDYQISYLNGSVTVLILPKSGVKVHVTSKLNLHFSYP